MRLVTLFTLLFVTSIADISIFPKSSLTSKELTSYVSGSALCFMMGLAVFRNGTIGFRPNQVDFLVLSFLVLIPCFHNYYFDDVSTASIAQSLYYATIYLSVRVWVPETKTLRPMALFYVVAVVFLAINLTLSALQFTSVLESNHSLTRISGSFGNPGPFAIYLACLSVLAISFTLTFPPANIGRPIFLTSVILVLTLLSLFELSSRSAWLSFSGGLLFIVFFVFRRRIFFFLRCHPAIALALFAAFFLVLMEITIWLYNLREGSSLGRVLIWKSTLLMVQEHFFNGVGIGRFNAEYHIYQGHFLNESKDHMEMYGALADQVPYAFNDYLQIFAERGALGAFNFLVILLYSLKNIGKTIRVNRPSMVPMVGVFSGLVTLLISSMTAYPLQTLPLSTLFWAFVALINGGERSDRQYNRVTKTSLLAVLLSCSIFWGLYFSIRGKAYIVWSRSESTIPDRESLLYIQQALCENGDIYNQVARSYLSDQMLDDALYNFQRATICSFDKNYHYDLGECYERLHMYEDAEREYKLVQYIVPHLIKPSYRLAKLYYAQGDLVRFKDEASTVFSARPKIDNMEVYFMRQEIFALWKQVMQASRRDY